MYVCIYIYIYIYGCIWIYKYMCIYIYVCIYIYIYIQLYICIYIYSHPQTDCFVLSELFSVARHAGRLKPESKPVQLYVRLSFRPLDHQADQGNFLRYFILATAAAFVYIFYTLSATRVLNSFEELLHYASGGRQFLRQRAQPPWGSIYVYIHTYI